MSHKSRIKETAITIVITNNRDYFQHTTKIIEREKPSTRRNKNPLHLDYKRLFYSSATNATQEDVK